jgi:hypothetical protein
MIERDFFAETERRLPGRKQLRCFVATTSVSSGTARASRPVFLHRATEADFDGIDLQGLLARAVSRTNSPTAPWRTDMTPDHSIATCADGTLAGYLVVGIFLLMFGVPAIFAGWIAHRRHRAMLRAG